MASKSKSTVWNFYDKFTDGGLCKLCKINVKTSGNTTNLKNHLKRKHPSMNIENISKMAKQSMLSTSFKLEVNADDPAEVAETNFATIANQIVDTVSLINEWLLK